MSQADVERFVEDLKNNEDLRNELSGHASGVGSVVAFAKNKGYDISAEEASAYISAQAGQELSDDELDAVAGGKGGHGGGVIATATEGVSYVATTIGVDVATSVGGLVATSTETAVATQTTTVVA